jgi:hypothetical protein
MVEYGIEDRPPIGQSVLLGLQHYLTMIGSNIAVPLVLAGLMGTPGPETARLVGTFVVGVSLLAGLSIPSLVDSFAGGDPTVVEEALVESSASDRQPPRSSSHR